MTLTIDYGTIAQIGAWLIALIASYGLVYEFVGLRALIAICPEGNRWWLAPARVGAMLAFGLLCANHPGTWS